MSASLGVLSEGKHELQCTQLFVQSTFAEMLVQMIGPRHVLQCQSCGHEIDLNEKTLGQAKDDQQHGNSAHRESYWWQSHLVCDAPCNYVAGR